MSASGGSSDPVAAGGADPTAGSVFAPRTREGAVLDRFVALRVGSELRRAESALSEDAGDEDALFAYAQPAARVEDLLRSLPLTLVTDDRPVVAVAHAFPLPHAHVSVALSGRWVQVFLHFSPVGARRSTGRALVVEMRRRASPEETVERLGVVLDAVRAGHIPWGSTRVE